MSRACSLRGRETNPTVQLGKANGLPPLSAFVDRATYGSLAGTMSRTERQTCIGRFYSRSNGMDFEMQFLSTILSSTRHIWIQDTECRVYQLPQGIFQPRTTENLGTSGLSLQSMLQFLERAGGSWR